MVERLGIPVAIDATGRMWRRAAIQCVPQPFVRPLRCGGCRTAVVAVHGYLNRFGTAVAPLYRLIDREANPHEDGCVYDFDTQAARILTQHRPLLSRHGEIYELQLPTLPKTPTTPQRSPDASTPPSRLQVAPLADVRLDPVIKAAAAIAHLLRHFDDDPVARARFRARYRGRMFTWSEFCFDARHDVKRLVEQIDTDADRPYAVIGTVKQVGSAASGASYWLQLDTRVPVRTAAGDRIQLFIRTHEQSTLSDTVGECVVCYGRWSLFTPPRGGAWATLWADELGAVATV